VLPGETMVVTTEEGKEVEAVIGKPAEDGVAVVEAILKSELEPESEDNPDPLQPEAKPESVVEGVVTQPEPESIVEDIIPEPLQPKTEREDPPIELSQDEPQPDPSPIKEEPEPEPEPVIEEHDELKPIVDPEPESFPVKKELERSTVQRIAEPEPVEQVKDPLPKPKLIVELSPDPQPEPEPEPVVTVIEPMVTEDQPDPERTLAPVEEVKEPELQPAPVIAVVERIATGSEPGPEPGVTIVERAKTEPVSVADPVEKFKDKAVPKVESVCHDTPLRVPQLSLIQSSLNCRGREARREAQGEETRQDKECSSSLTSH
jgi:hypothetical protein